MQLSSSCFLHGDLFHCCWPPCTVKQNHSSSVIASVVILTTAGGEKESGENNPVVRIYSGSTVITRSVVYFSCSLSLAFLAEVTGRGYQREGFSGFLRAVTVTERAIARSVTVNALSPPRPRTRFARPRFALSRSDWAIHFPTQTPVGWFHARLIRTIGS